MFGLRKLTAKAKAASQPQAAPQPDAPAFEWDMWHTTEITNSLIAQLGTKGNFIGAVDHLGFQTEIMPEGVQVAKNIPKLQAAA